MREFKVSGIAQGTTYTATYFAKDSVVKKSQIDSILNVIDLSMSLYRSNSIINQFNIGETTKITVDKHMGAVLDRSFQINKETGGLFDITVQPLMRLWGFHSGHILNFVPDTAKINEVINLETGMDKISFRKGVLNKKRKNIEIDLNGIAQGYSVDVVADFLEEKGVNSYVFELGGEIRVKGPKPDGNSIKIGIEGPVENSIDMPAFKHRITFNEGAITTSGSYSNFIAYKGKRYGHVVNPKTGYPTSDEIISVTVFAKKAIDADGYDNALMLMRVEKAIEFVEAKRDLEVYIIYKKADGSVADTLTSGFKKMLIKPVKV